MPSRRKAPVARAGRAEILAAALKEFAETGFRGASTSSGDGRHMAPAVRETFVRLRSETAGLSLEEAERWMRGLEREGHYLADVFAS